MSPKSSYTRQSIRAQRAAKQRQQRRIVAGSIIGAIVVLVVLIGSLWIFNSNQPVGDITVPTEVARPQANFNAMGNPDAPVKITEYSDFQCPFCKRFADETEMQVVENLIKQGKVYFVYVPYGPGGNYIGPESKTAAMAAFCAGDQGKFWEYKDILFANHTGENVGDFTNKRLRAFAEALNLDMNAFNKCFDGNKYNDKLAEGIAAGRALQVGGTPTFIFNDGVDSMVGAQPFSNFQQKVDALLAR
jgi:protein-disulfide isomerase